MDVLEMVQNSLLTFKHRFSLFHSIKASTKINFLTKLLLEIFIKLFRKNSRTLQPTLPLLCFSFQQKHQGVKHCFRSPSTAHRRTPVGDNHMRGFSLEKDSSRDFYFKKRYKTERLQQILIKSEQTCDKNKMKILPSCAFKLTCFRKL